MTDIFDRVQDFCDENFLVDVADKVPIFICSIGAHVQRSKQVRNVRL